jgi:hypothetical protein
MTLNERPAQIRAVGDGLAEPAAAPVARPDDAADQLGRWFNGRLSRLLSASTLAVLLGTAAYQYDTGFRQGVADRLGIGIEFVSSSNDPAAAPAEMVILSLLGLFAIGLFVSLIPAFTSWPIFGIASLYEFGCTAVAALRHFATWRYHLVAALAFLTLAVVIEVAARLIKRLLKRRRRREWPRRLVRLIVHLPSSRLPPQADNLVTIGGVCLIVAVVVWLAMLGAGQFGTWLGYATAVPDQAVIAGGHTYAWLGTTDDGLMVVRAADFCGGQPEDARQVAIAGRRSLLIKAEGVEVIRLDSRLHLVDRCH